MSYCMTRALAGPGEKMKGVREVCLWWRPSQGGDCISGFTAGVCASDPSHTKVSLMVNIERCFW